MPLTLSPTIKTLKALQHQQSFSKLEMLNSGQVQAKTKQTGMTQGSFLCAVWFTQTLLSTAAFIVTMIVTTVMTYHMLCLEHKWICPPARWTLCFYRAFSTNKQTLMLMIEAHAEISVVSHRFRVNCSNSIYWWPEWTTIELFADLLSQSPCESVSGLAQVWGQKLRCHIFVPVHSSGSRPSRVKVLTGCRK